MTNISSVSLTKRELRQIWRNIKRELKIRERYKKRNGWK